MHKTTHSFIHSFINSSINYSSICCQPSISCSNLSIHSYIRSLICQSSRPLMHTFITVHPLIYSYSHLSMYVIHQCIHSSTHPSMSSSIHQNLFVHLLIHSIIYSSMHHLIYSSSHPSVYPPIRLIIYLFLTDFSL